MLSQAQISLADRRLAEAMLAAGEAVGRRGGSAPHKLVCPDDHRADWYLAGAYLACPTGHCINLSRLVLKGACP
jgi:hypothetical protein